MKNPTVPLSLPRMAPKKIRGAKISHSPETGAIPRLFSRRSEGLPGSRESGEETSSRPGTPRSFSATTMPERKEDPQADTEQRRCRGKVAREELIPQIDLEEANMVGISQITGEKTDGEGDPLLTQPAGRRGAGEQTQGEETHKKLHTEKEGIQFIIRGDSEESINYSKGINNEKNNAKVEEWRDLLLLMPTKDKNSKQAVEKPFYIKETQEIKSEIVQINLKNGKLRVTREGYKRENGEFNKETK